MIVRNYKSIVLIVVTFLSFGAKSQSLNTYECIYNHWNIEGFLTQFNRALDDEGIVIQKGEYHALIISFYGIINYHEFLKTNDSLYYHRVVNQYKYFKDTSKLRYFDNGESVGLPYLFAFNGLTPPWYSGMTQGTATSFLLRYYSMTNDETALDLSRKLVNFMIKDEKNGGTMGVTKEGLPWIEEYPNCEKSKSVLNGFINGLIGLREYLEFFPKDTVVREIHDNCYEAMFSSLNMYDTPNWTTYNRNNKSISNGYMRYQLSEFDHMYNIYGDERLKQQMAIWSKLAVNKLCKELTFYKAPRFEYAKKIDSKGGGLFEFRENEKFQASLENKVEKYSIYQNGGFKKGDFKFDGQQYYCEIEFSDLLKSDQLSITAYLNEMNSVVNYEFDGTKLTVFSVNGFDRLAIKFAKKVKKNNQLIAVNEYNRYNYQLPFFGVVDISKKFNLEAGKKYRIVYVGKNLIDGKVYYRIAPSTQELGKKNFLFSNYFDLQELNFIAPETGSYELFVSYSIYLPYSYLDDFDLILEQMDN